jgi:hypothetical protein
MADTETKRSRLSAQPKRRRSTPRTITAESGKSVSQAANAHPAESRKHSQTSPEIYRTLASLNECLKTVSDGLDALQAAELIAPEASELRKAAAEELRSDINSTVTINMHTLEMEAANYYEQKKFRLENNRGS